MSFTTTVNEVSSLHKCRTEIPNILFELGLDCFALAVYMIFKRIAGDQGKCWASQESIAKMAGIGLTKLREIKKELAKPRELLGNVPLIYVQKRADSGESDIITIEDIWPQNFTLYFIQKNNRGTRQTEGGAPRGEPKEDLIQEDPSLKDHRSPPASSQPRFEEAVSEQCKKESNATANAAAFSSKNDEEKREKLLKDNGFDEGAVFYLSKKHTLNQIRAVAHYMEGKRIYQHAIKNKQGLFRRLLSDKSIANDWYADNVEFFNKLQEKYKLKWEMTPDCVIVEEGKELSLGITSATFVKELIRYAMNHLEQNGDVWEGV